MTEVADALSAQARQVGFAHRSQSRNQPAEELARRLAEWTGGRLPCALLTTGGSEAVEAAIQLALSYHAARGEPHRTVVLSRHMSYHGATLGARSAGGNPARRAPYATLLHNWPQVYAPYCYGVRGDAVLVAPPLTIADDDIAELLARLNAALRQLVAETTSWRTPATGRADLGPAANPAP